MRKALQLDAGRSDTYLSLALLQMHGQQWDAAEVSFKKAVELSPKSTNALISLGNFYQTRGRFPEAEQLFRRAIGAAGDDPRPRLSLAGRSTPTKNPARPRHSCANPRRSHLTNSWAHR